MDRKVALAGSLMVALLGTTFGWWLRGTDGDDAAVAPRTEVREAPRVQRGPAPRFEAERPTALPPPPPPSTSTVSAHETALRAVAELTGEGVVRCSVGDTLPDGPVAGMTRARVEHGVLVGSVEDPEGQARIQLESDARSDAPRLVVRWSGAWPGETGSCEAIRPQRVAVTGTVVDARGRPVGGVEVGNGVDGFVTAGPDGHFVAACWRGSSCPLAARRSRMAGWGDFETLVPDGPLGGVQLVVDGPQAEGTVLSTLQEWVEDSDRVEQQADPLQLALADQDLPADARAVVEGWLQEEREQRELLRTALAEVTLVTMR
ncbi:MAG: hypothetical protein R3F59_02865 [Myxococcota bacterium]